MNYWPDMYKWGRVWRGPFDSDDNFHYAYSDGELDPANRLVWIQSRTAEPPGPRISEAEAIAMLISRRWPNLEAEGWEHEQATQIIADIVYHQPMKAHAQWLKRHLKPT